MRGGVGARFGARMDARMDARGFTLLEVVVVILILSVLGAFALPAFRTEGPPRGDLDQATARMEALFQFARDSAVRGSTPVTVILDSITGEAWIDARDVSVRSEPLGLPPSVQVQLFEARPRFTFLPGGGMSARDSIQLLGPGGAVRTLTLNPWTGHATVR
jgi:prepilin-type N-terminal cleavage/methylation domain-containing protein